MFYISIIYLNSYSKTGNYILTYFVTCQAFIDDGQLLTNNRLFYVINFIVINS